MYTKEKNAISIFIEENEMAQKMYYDLCENGDRQGKLLWEILFEADVSDKAHLKDLVYEFGSLIKKKDGFERLVFIRLASLF